MTGSIRNFEKLNFTPKLSVFCFSQGQTSKYDRLAQLCLLRWRRCFWQLLPPRYFLVVSVFWKTEGTLQLLLHFCHYCCFSLPLVLSMFSGKLLLRFVIAVVFVSFCVHLHYWYCSTKLCVQRSDFCSSGRSCSSGWRDVFFVSVFFLLGSGISSSVGEMETSVSEFEAAGILNCMPRIFGSPPLTFGRFSGGRLWRFVAALCLLFLFFFRCLFLVRVGLFFYRIRGLSDTGLFLRM